MQKKEGKKKRKEKEGEMRCTHFSFNLTLHLRRRGLRAMG